jgi:spore coat protein CotH
MTRRLRVALTVPVVVQLMLRGVALAQVPAPVPAPDITAPFFDDTVLQDIRLSMNSRDWQTLRTNYTLNAYYPADFRWGTTVVRNVGIRSRGNGSRSGIKPGLRIDFDRYSTKQEFLGLKSVILRNNTQDPSNLHERLSMLLFRRMGLHASREAHTRLWVNNVFWGVYTIVESVDKDFLDRTFGENDGYLFKYDYPPTELPYYFEDRGTDPALYVPLPFQPETRETDPHPGAIRDLVQTINTASDALFRTAIEEFMDLSLFIRHVAVEVFLADYDAVLGDWGMNNYYLYRPLIGHRFRIIAWDKSQAFSSPVYPIWHNITDVPLANQNRLMMRALQYPDLRNLYLDTLVEAGRVASEIPPDTLPGDTRGWLEREADRGYNQIAAAVWADTNKPYSNEEFEAAVEAVREFARTRTTHVDFEVRLTRGLP